MKKSKKYVRWTLIGFHLAIVLFIGIARAFENPNGEYIPARTTEAALAELENFDSIQIRGYFELEILQQENYQIDYSRLDSARATFSADVEGEVLIIEGHFSNLPEEKGRIRIGTPSLATLNVDNAPELTINGFTRGSLSLTTRNVRSITLDDVELETFELNASRIDRLDLREAQVGTRTLTIRNIGSVGLTLLE